MAVTTNQQVIGKDKAGLMAFPVASGETIYEGTLVCVKSDGYLYNLTSARVNGGVRLIGVVADDTINATGPAATTANGSISGSLEAASDPAGDKTVRQVWTEGTFRLTFTAIAQSDVGKTVYAQDNFTCDETQIAGVKIGTLVTYLSATSGYVNINEFYQNDGWVSHRGALTFPSAATSGGVLSWINPTGETIMIRNVIFDITTAASVTGITLDVGVAAGGSTTSDTLMDGVSLDTAIVANNINNVGTNGKSFAKATSTQYITATPSAACTTAVGTYELNYRIWE